MKVLTAMLLGTVLLVSGCAEAGASTPRTPTATSATAQPQAVTTSAAGFNGTDIAWIQLMIPMNTQALRLLDTVPARTTDPAARALAAQVAAGHRTELTGLRALLTRAGVPATNVHEGHLMPGMVSAEDLRVTGQASGTAFTGLLVAKLRAHFKQQAMVSHSEQGAGVDKATKALAATMAKTRATQLTQLDRLAS